VFGDVWLRYGATKSLSGGASVSGSFIQYPGSGPNTVDPVLNQGIADANAAAAAATALAVSSLYSSITTIDLKNAPLALAAATAANTTYVLKLTDLTLSGSRAVLTLNGGGYANVNYVIDISRYMTLAAGSSIVLTGSSSHRTGTWN